MTQRTFPTSIDIPEAQRAQLVSLLNDRLSDTFDLYSQLKQAHWNVKGSDFIQLHELFDQLATTMLGHVDLVAERSTALGGTALGTVRLAAERSTLPEYPLDAVGGLEHVRALVERYGAYARRVRQAIEDADKLGDSDTADLFTEISRATDKDLWFLEAHVQA
ncbi:MAG: DNA starvation/stationary phase protection protein Dps [Acidimicrobiia bacterium]|nr:DNA starvation/stationary phase protection protein Dps [Acidimicrobiia bacterium]